MIFSIFFKKEKIIPNFTTKETRFLSNFYPFKRFGTYPHRIEIYYENMLFLCVETAYHAAKTLDMNFRYEISQMNPFDVFALAKNGGIPVRENWNNMKYDIMKDLLSQKFQHPELKKMLLDTGNATLIEGNTWGDVYWGVCDGVGENNLGKILMDIRKYLKQH